MRNPFLEPERDVVEGTDIADAGDPAFEVEAGSLHRPEHGVGLADVHERRSIRHGVIDVGVGVDEAGHHGLSPDVDDTGVFRPVRNAGRKDFIYLVSPDNDRPFMDGSARAVENPPAPEDQHSFGPPGSGRHGDAPRIIGRLHFGIERFAAVLGFLLAGEAES
ncbi:MAG: hypothetical protein A2Y56_12835 [Candidatus Aminicenantes bacterium RBG_13_63_10]|nr:MAG: hypothetical protein A2Y56_12835 [Candidatus Aminicenantes bacterium RBG_13_63_10]